MRQVSARTRWTAGVAAACGAALVVGSLALVPASGTAPGAGWAAAPSAFAGPQPEHADASVSRASAALQRGLVAQGRLLATSAAAPAPGPVAAKVTATAATKVAAAPAASKARATTGPIWERMPVLEPGAQGDAVAFLQFKLRTKKTGWYGPMTLAAVIAYQESRGLPAKGYVGSLTWRAIYTKAKPVAAAAAPARSSSPSRSVVRTAVTSGKVCPAPGAAFGSGWGVPRSGHLHQGVDLVARRGAPIVAVESGYILRAGVQSNGAIRIVAQGASGPKYFYGHMDSITVGAGSRVTRGQVIGYMGDTGSRGSVHLHFEYWPSGRESAAVDPYPLLKSLCW